MPPHTSIKIVKTSSSAWSVFASHNNTTKQSPPPHCQQAHKKKSVYIEPSDVEDEVDFSDDPNKEMTPPPPSQPKAASTSMAKQKAQELIDSLGTAMSNTHSLTTDENLKCACKETNASLRQYRKPAARKSTKTVPARNPKPKSCF
ncbi:hypothetical protein P691DRAFT_766535 [Macrolepiota fuliginosa MF-IS2]|uniref:Uncharacterized protein n=1 Tax=Macrolepiota fuliginosa MF-IS2 TaxID=1400762 RepID=A0A9P5WYK8_9AGAR|nr:hypothetical protein P691DRAFT_766535 [Macrolepiota fuliginosa MF-IS2]